LSIIIIVVFVITFMQATYNCVPETNHVSRVHSVAAVLCLQFCAACNVISHAKCVWYYYVSTFQSMCALLVSWFCTFLFCCSGIFWVILSCIQLHLLLLVSLLLFLSTCA